MIFSVVFPLPVSKRFDYVSPTDMVLPDDPIGCRVRVSFGPRQLVGLVVAATENAAAETPAMLKPLSFWVEKTPVLDPLQMELGRWLAWRTACSEGEALFALLPPDKEKAHVEDDMHHHAAAWLETDAGTSSSLTWTSDQKKAIDLLHTEIFAETRASSTILLRGVAASGKTEVYFAAIDDVLRKHQNVLVLAPEVGLVMQLAELLRHRFGSDTVAVWHGAVPLSERKKLWWKIRAGEVSIVVGARSAALLPLPNVGLFVLDEEHDTAWKEDRKPRFHARDVVIERARLSHALTILSTATPTFELEQMVKENRVREIVLSERAVSAATPLIELIDMNDQKRRGVLSHQLKKALDETIARKEQAILFINRRGFHRYLKCGHCEWIARCPQCAVTLVLHKKGAPAAALVCHQCNFRMAVPTGCPSCKKKNLYSGGVGTERVLEELKEHMPWVRAARWDLDAVKKKGALEDLLADVRAQELDVLVGTQLVAQGFHFPHVTLVGVVDADVALYQPNFRAAERTFQLLMQVAGRAGRDVVVGRVLIQTHQPSHSALRHASAMDFEGFFREESAFRRDLGYPPFTHLIEVEMSHKDEKKSEKEMSHFLAWVETLKVSEPIRVLGPMMSTRHRKGKAALQCILKIAAPEFDSFLTALQASPYMKTHVRIDVDPS